MVYAGLSDVTWRQECIELPDDSCLLLYTDGVTEARNESEFFGLENLEAVVRKHGSSPPEQLVRTIVDTLSSFGKGRPRDDDHTLLHVRWP